MSDIFDHELDAWESYDRDDGDGAYSRSRCSTHYSSSYDPLYYHEKIEGVRVITRTEKAYLLAYDECEFWTPKALCKHFDEVKGTVYILRSFLEDKLDEECE
jgi:hypothetical protein